MARLRTRLATVTAETGCQFQASLEIGDVPIRETVQ
jgi:hypothetical protein